MEKSLSKEIEIAQNKYAVKIYNIAHQLIQNCLEITSCRCSHQEGRLLIDVHNGLYGNKFSGCLEDSRKLELYINYMITRTNREAYIEN